jgi:hypothetical protein
MEEEVDALLELKGDFTSIVASLDTCLKGLKALQKTVKKTTTASATASAPKTVTTKKGIQSLSRVLNKAEEQAALTGSSYGTAVLDALSN